MTQSRERIVERVTAALTGDPAPIAIHHARKIDARGVADHFWIVSGSIPSTTARPASTSPAPATPCTARPARCSR